MRPKFKPVHIQQLEELGLSIIGIRQLERRLPDIRNIIIGPPPRREVVDRMKRVEALLNSLHEELAAIFEPTSPESELSRETARRFILMAMWDHELVFPPEVSGTWDEGGWLGWPAERRDVLREAIAFAETKAQARNAAGSPLPIFFIGMALREAWRIECSGEPAEHYPYKPSRNGMFADLCAVVYAAAHGQDEHPVPDAALREFMRREKAGQPVGIRDLAELAAGFIPVK